MICVDRNTMLQIFGSLMDKPTLLSDTDKYQLSSTDFNVILDRYIFSAIYNLYMQGANRIHAQDIENYLSKNEVGKRIMEEHNGIQFLVDCETCADPSNFQVYYNKFKKINLLRDLKENGYDVSYFWNENPLSVNFETNNNFENSTTKKIIEHYQLQLGNFEKSYVINSTTNEGRASDGIRELIVELKRTPEIGVRLQGNIFNTITRGGRKGKLYLRSASTGMGKTRSMVGDACNIAYPIRYEPKYGKWIAIGEPEKVLYVMTEQEPAEIQTMILAYLTGINEEVFLYGTFKEEHMERINKAIKIMEDYKDYFLTAQIPDPCESIVKNLFRRYNLQYGVENFFYDYIFSSPAMLNEYRDLGVQEHVCLRLFTTVLKNLATELNSFILTSTQISNDEEDGFKDFRNIRGSKAICDLADFACIMSRPSKEELKLVSSFQKAYNIQPNCVIDVFKNRRGRWTQIRIWTRQELGICRKYDLFITTPDLKQIDDFHELDIDFMISDEIQNLVSEYNKDMKEEPEQIVEMSSYDPEQIEISSQDPIELLDVNKAFGDMKAQVREKRFTELI